MKYDSLSPKAQEFINHDKILETIKYINDNKNNRTVVSNIITKAKEMKGLSFAEAGILLETKLPFTWLSVKKLAIKIKKKFYGNRIVLFAPLYLSNYCVNGCVYCPFKHSNKDMPRKRLTQEEITKEVIALQDMGHKRIALETGEDPVNIPIEYIIESIKTIYDIKHKNGAIRRANVNIAATTVENYKKLAEAKIGTYVLFQETYNKETYSKLHPTGPKSNYDYHTEAMDRAVQGGIEDVGLGVLYGLENYLYEFIGILMHAEHLKSVFGVGPHTISVPRICSGSGVDKDQFLNGISDKLFEKIVAVLRIAVPYTGIIISTRETVDSRKKVLKLGVSQVSGGSKTNVGGYTSKEELHDQQFELGDNRTLDSVVSWLLELGYLPSFCTACYHEGRIGEKFMSLLANGQIIKCCQSNAILTLEEYIQDYASDKTKKLGHKMIERELKLVTDPNHKKAIMMKLEKIKNNERNFRF